MKILISGKMKPDNVYTCKCGCLFEYSREDIQTLGIYNKCVICPECHTAAIIIEEVVDIEIQPERDCV